MLQIKSITFFSPVVEIEQWTDFQEEDLVRKMTSL